ncbi:ribonuclease H-like domain-containing protein [Tanacetum coccineum]
MHAPLQSHFSAALRVLRYLKSAPGTGISYYKQNSQYYKQNSFSLHGFSDADWAKCPKTRKSVSGYCLYLCNNLLSWKSKKSKQPFLGVEGLLPVNLYCDSSSAISIAGNPVFHEKTKHFEIDLHLVRDKVADGVVKVLKVASASNVADVFTKGLSSMVCIDRSESCSEVQLTLEKAPVKSLILVTMSDNIPFDIQTEIIKRAPVKSVIRFRTVSKSWKSLIDSSEFIAVFNHALRDDVEHGKNGELVVETQDTPGRWVFFGGTGYIGNTYSALEVYDPCSKQITHLGMFGRNGSFFISSYKETLLLLDHSDSCEYPEIN